MLDLSLEIEPNCSVTSCLKNFRCEQRDVLGVCMRRNACGCGWCNVGLCGFVKEVVWQ